MSIIKRTKLNEQELSEIKALADICNKHDNITLKLNPEMLAKRAGNEHDDFLYYIDDKLIGFLGLYGFGRNEIEMSGMVHPDYRRMNIFSSLFDEAEKERLSRNIERLLIICENKSASAKGFALSKGAEYSFSEYYMELEDNTDDIMLKNLGISLRHGNMDDFQSIKQQDGIYFGIPFENTDDEYVLRRLDNTYIAELDGKVIGKINITEEEDSAFLSGFGVLPEFRGKGYGREILGLALVEGRNIVKGKAALEVAATNRNALNLYKSYGFKEVTGYDYYKIENL